MNFSAGFLTEVFIQHNLSIKWTEFALIQSPRCIHIFLYIHKDMHIITLLCTLIHKQRHYYCIVYREQQTIVYIIRGKFLLYFSCHNNSHLNPKSGVKFNKKKNTRKRERNVCFTIFSPKVVCIVLNTNFFEWTREKSGLKI